MWKLASTVALIVYLALPNLARAAYLIRLKNGSEFVAARYWQEGQQVMFDAYGGTFGVDKAFVIKIEQSDKPLKLISAAQETREDKAQPVAVKETKEPTKSPAPAEAKVEGNRADDPILKEFYSLKEQSTDLEGMLTSELLEYSQKLSTFKKMLQTTGKTNEYLREFGELYKMGDAAQSILQSRRQ
jgi:hypothetical protein